MKNLVFIMTATLAISTQNLFAQAPTQTRSEFTATFSDFTVTDSFARDAKTGAYVLAGTQYSALHTLACDCGNKNATKESYRRTDNIEGDPFQTVQIHRRADYSELQFSGIVVDTNGIAKPESKKMRIRLLGNSTWKDFESGREVEAELLLETAAAQNDEIEFLNQTFATLSEDIFMGLYYDTLENQSARIMNSTLGDMTTIVKNVRPRRIRMSLNSITVQYQAEETVVRVEIKPNAVGPRPEPKTKPGTNNTNVRMVASVENK